MLCRAPERNLRRQDTCYKLENVKTLKAIQTVCEISIIISLLAAHKVKPRTRWSEDLAKVAGKNWTRMAEDRVKWRPVGEAYVHQWTKTG